MSRTPKTDAIYFRQGATMYELAGLCKELEQEAAIEKSLNERFRERLEKFLAENIKLNEEADIYREALRMICACDWKTPGELRGMARVALEKGGEA
jgi:hypothetical protein